jgi:hypothetical protein
MDLSEIWVEDSAAGGEPARWRGHLTHVPGGQRHYFQELAAIPALIAPYLAQPDAPRDESDD